VASVPLPRVDAAIVSLVLEAGFDIRLGEHASFIVGIRERPILAIGSGSPLTSFFNRIGPVVSLQF